jgi:hypothetical protein
MRLYDVDRARWALVGVVDLAELGAGAAREMRGRRGLGGSTGTISSVTMSQVRQCEAKKPPVRLLRVDETWEGSAAHH